MAQQPWPGMELRRYPFMIILQLKRQRLEPYQPGATAWQPPQERYMQMMQGLKARSVLGF